MAFTDVTPKQEEPMRAVSAETVSVIEKQPPVEPAPMAQQEAASNDDDDDSVHMRGGVMTCGFNCCRGHCSFHESCC